MLVENLNIHFERSIKQNWDLPAFSNYKDVSNSYKQVADRILYLHCIFKKFDLKKGDKIALFGKNSVNWAITYLASVSYGIVIVPILPDFKPDDVHHIVNHSDSCILFTADSLFDELDETSMNNLDAIFSLKDFSYLFSKKKTYQNFLTEASKEYLQDFDNKLTSENYSLPEIKNEDLAAIIYTSGTTGFSKGVMLPHKSLISNIIYAKEHMPLNPGDTIVSFLPIAHVFGCAFEFLFPFCSGCHITFLGKTPSPKVLIKSFQEIHPRLILSVPLVIEKIYKKQIKPTLQKGSMKILLKIPFTKKLIYKKINEKLTIVFGRNFREIVIGGAALNEEVESFLRDIKFRYTVGYGMTECGPLISYAGWKKFKRASCGIVVDRMKTKIDSSDPQKVIGEIMVKGDNVMYGYYKNKEATKAAIDDLGWLRTGDLGIMDEDNFIFIKGRSKSMILGPAGKNIYPEEIEARLNNLPFVQESIVVDRDSKLVALVYPDMEQIDALDLEEKELQLKMDENKKSINKIFPAYMAITKIEIYPEEFEKTPKKSIKRFLYTTQK